MARPSTNDATTVSTPSQCPQALARRPARNSTSAPAAGSTNSSQASDVTPLAVAISGSSGACATTAVSIGCGGERGAPGSSSGSVLEQVGVVDRRRPAGAEDRHDDGQPDHDLGRGHDHHEERHDLAVELAV